MPQPDTTATLAGRLAQTMRAQNLTQRGLAEQVTSQSGEALSQVAIQKIVSGATRHPKRLPDIALALGVSASWLAHGAESVDSGAGSNTASGYESGSGNGGAGSHGDTAPGNTEPLPWKIKTGAVPVVGTAQLGTNGYFERE